MKSPLRPVSLVVGIALFFSATPLAAQTGAESRGEKSRFESPERLEAVYDRLDPGAESAERPGLLDPVFGRINPARIQRRFDEWLGLDSDDRSDRPEAPEIPEPVFFDVIRPLGDLKYTSELNYLFNSSTRNGPTLQIIEYEYVFADWRAAELDLFYFNNKLEILAPYYQRTIGVGPKGNWVHGYQLSLDLYLRSGFLGGSPAYNFSWKPDRDSRFSSTFFVGANRALIGGFNPTPGGLMAPLPAGAPDDRVFGAWRPMFNADFFYKLSEKWIVGIENDFFFHGVKRLNISPCPS